ncbi:hypothetical protein GCM10020001_026780 [Nonomuraea salmonea]
MVTPDEERLLRRAIELAAEAREGGNPPFGSLLAAADGTILAEERNSSLTDHDITAHPELKLARWAARELDPRDGRGHHDVHQLPALWHVRRRHRPLGPRPGGLRPVGRAARRPQAPRAPPSPTRPPPAPPCTTRPASPSRAITARQETTLRLRSTTQSNVRSFVQEGQCPKGCGWRRPARSHC